MKKILILSLSICIFVLINIYVFAEESFVLKTGISKIDNVPKEFFGTWSVQATRTFTNDEKSFAKDLTNLWNLKRNGNVIELGNPITGATAKVYLNNVEDKEITFTHSEEEGNVKYRDTVIITINGDTFEGINELALEITKKDANGKPKNEYKKATYKIKGFKFLQ